MRQLDAGLIAAQNSGRAKPAIFLAAEDRPLLAEHVRAVRYGPSGRGSYNFAVSNGASNRDIYAAFCWPDGRAFFYSDDLLGTRGLARLVPGVTVQNRATLALLRDWPASGYLCLFYIDAGGRTLRYLSSANGGLDWGAPQTIVAYASGAVLAMGATLTPQGPVLALMLDDRLRLIYLSGGAWADLPLQNVSFAGCSSLDLDCSPGDAAGLCGIVLNGQAADGASLVQAVQFSRGSLAFSGPATLFSASAGGGLSCKSVGVVAPATGTYSTRSWLYCWQESQAGLSRPVLMWTALWHTPGAPLALPFNDAAPLRLRKTGALYSLAGSEHCYSWWGWNADDLRQRRSDLGRFVRGFRLRQREGEAGSLALRLADDGRFARAGQTGDEFQMLTVGGSINLGPGYQTAGGPRYAYQRGWTITAVQRRLQRAGGNATAELVLHATDPRGWLELARHPRLRQWLGLSNSALLDHCLTPVCLERTYPAEARLQRASLQVAAAAGSSYAALFDKLCAELGYRERWPNDQQTHAAQARLELLPYEQFATTPLSLGAPGQTPLLSCRQQRPPQPHNHVLVTGVVAATRLYCYGEAFDSAALAAQPQLRTLHRPNSNLGSEADCQDAANRQLLRFLYNRLLNVAVCRYQLQAEVGDSVLLTDAWLGLNAARRWLRGIDGEYDAARGLFQTTLHLYGSE